jgi:PPOX class probable F420-dependent enzyme
MEGKYISVISHTKSGEPIPTQVWFVEKDDNIYIMTTQKRYKVRRIQNNPHVKVAQSTMLGKPKDEYIDGIARILSDDEFKPIVELFEEKYRMFKILFKQGKEGEEKVIAIEITLK